MLLSLISYNFASHGQIGDIFIATSMGNSEPNNWPNAAARTAANAKPDFAPCAGLGERSIKINTA